MTRALLDTHAFLWFIMGDESLSPVAREAIESPASEKLVSLVSLWEIAVKHSLGKLPLSKPFQELISEQMQENGFIPLPVKFEHIGAIVDLPWHHRDPFDRLLIAQALSEEIAFISKDRQFGAYGLELIW